uniref:Mitochondrial import inner membrane translocase subunit TIM50 n=1 Tax=Trichuris muris TaxID=70415 RepID=A0A5S6QUF8_TRIMR
MLFIRSLLSVRSEVVLVCSNGTSHFLRQFHSVARSRVRTSLFRQLRFPAKLPTVLQVRKFASIAKDDLKKEHVAKVQRSTRIGLACMLIAFSGVATFVVVRWGAPPTDTLGNRLEDEFSHLPFLKQRLLRSWKECRLFEQYIKEPSREKLLPEQLKEPFYQPPITLVVELSGVLVHPEWTYQTGWRFKKRPGVEHFIQQVGYPHFELVIFTHESGLTAHPIVESLDPSGLAMYRLYRDATKYLKGEHVKDLSCLNRDLSKVILIDWNPKACQLQPENTLLVPKWDGSDHDADLVDLAAMLTAIAAGDVADVRPILEYYSAMDNPVEEFRKRRRLLMEGEVRSETHKDESMAAQYARRFFGLGRS